MTDAMRAFFIAQKGMNLLEKVKNQLVLFFKNAFHRVFVLFNNFFRHNIQECSTLVLPEN